MSDTDTRRRIFRISIDVAIHAGEDADEICNAVVARDLDEGRVVDLAWACCHTTRDMRKMLDQ